MPFKTINSDGSYAGRGVRRLVVAHVAVGFAAACLAKSLGGSSLMQTCIGILWYAQLSLLGVWCSVGTGAHWRRLAGSIGGVGLIYTLAATGYDDLSVELLIAVVVASTFVTIPLLVARWFRIVIQFDLTPTTLSSRFRFSIRHLLLLTFITACLIAVARVILPASPHRQMITGIIAYFVMFNVAGVAPVWFVLATRRPVLYGLGVIAVCAIGGYGVSGSFDPQNGIRGMIALSVWAAIVVASLLVVRACGYRLVRSPARALGVGGAGEVVDQTGYSTMQQSIAATMAP